ncbi:MAG: diphthine--ammonia ligase [Candidatus Dadabacteria bacterium]|nr:diphthine--ammonia ligase [Candidatus Dadabacteria bacterium]MDE0476966.1 diphthine--ammonia ligase [Candidatus Dadabacteria bacterium]MXW44240.1 diphthine--ammonia ligase [Candidatus Dadabacteria bacterium]MYB27045.1 diphthine--ammonia ligase [Candidatus Dadabacteria bacterium]
MSEPIALCFSGGKDSAMALQEIRRRGEYHVAELVTTVTDAYDRVSMHGVRRTLLRRQAESLGLPLVEVVVPPGSSNAVYEREMGKAFSNIRNKGIRRIAFGDIFLEDLRDYRERQLAASGLTCLFPLWKKPTRSLARTFIDEGFRAVTVCVYSKMLDESFAGRRFDTTFLDDLPSGVDPCGENGEFHTFVFDGPIFSQPIEFAGGTVVERDGFFFYDLL